jgi:uncharacterized protein (DUF697 family)
MITRDEKVDRIIKTSVITAASLGVQPFFWDAPALLGGLAVMVVGIAAVYDFPYSKEAAIPFVKQIIKAGLLRAAAIKGTATVALAGMAAAGTISGPAAPIVLGGVIASLYVVTGVVNGTVAYAIGHAAKEYFKASGAMSNKDLKQVYLKYLNRFGVGHVVNILKGIDWFK